MERAVPGKPGVVQRHYLDDDGYRDAGVTGTATLMRPGDSRTSRDRTRSQSSSSLLRPDPVFTVADVLAGAWTGKVRVQIADSAWKGFHREQETHAGFRRIGDEFELGGGIFGRFKDGTFSVEETTGRIRGDDAARHSGLLDLEFIERMQKHHKSSTGHKLLGFWHSHPNIEGLDPERRFSCPSLSDLRCLEALHDESPARIGSSIKWPTLGLILAPRSNDDEYGAGWDSPLVTGFVARGKEDYPTVEFCRVTVDGNRRATGFTFLPTASRADARWRL
jgi:hypothetical protein